MSKTDRTAIVRFKVRSSDRNSRQLARRLLKNIRFGLSYGQGRSLFISDIFIEFVGDKGDGFKLVPAKAKKVPRARVPTIDGSGRGEEP